MIVLSLIVGLSPIHKIIGDFKWQRPAWLVLLEENIFLKIKSYILNNLKIVIPLFILLFVTLLGGAVYLLQPPPSGINVVSIAVEPIQQTYYSISNEKVDKNISPLIITFSQSVAPLKNIGKKINEGIVLEPNIKGEWKWTDESTLIFKPNETWELGSKIKIKLGDELISPKFVLKEKSFEIKTPLLVKNSVVTELYEDPRNPKNRSAIFTIIFNNPVDISEMEKLIRLKQINYEGKKENVKPLSFTLSANKLQDRVNVLSSQIDIPQNEGEVLLSFEGEVKPFYGKGKSEISFTEKLRIPGIYDYFHVNVPSINIIENQKGLPQHILEVPLSIGVKVDDLKKSLRLFQLPINDGRKKINWKKKKYDIDIVEASKKYKELTYNILPSAEEFPRTHLIEIFPEHSSYIYFHIKKGMNSASEFKLVEDFNDVLYVEQFPKTVKFLSDGQILQLKGEKKLSIYSINTSKLNIEIGQVIEEQVHHILSNAYSSEDKIIFNSPYYFSHENLSYVQKFKKVVQNPSRTSPSYTTLDFSEYLNKVKNGQNLKGLFFVKIKGDDDEKVIDQKFVQITDLGIIIKDDIVGNKSIFVSSISNGEPVEDVEISMVEKNGFPVLKGKTNRDGIVNFPVYKTDDYTKRANGIILKKGSDLAFMNFNDYQDNLEYSRFDVGGEQNSNTENEFKAYLFTDRQMYRPGEEVRLGHIIKQENWANDLKGIPLAINIISSSGDEILSKQFEANASGFNDTIFKLSKYAKTGTYYANLFGVDNKGADKSLFSIGSTTFQVEEFEPDKLKLNSFIREKISRGWVKSFKLNLDIELKNLFGVVSSGNKVKSKLLLTQARINVSEFPDFTFSNPQKYFDTVSDEIGTGITSESGQLELKIDLEKYAPKIYQMTVVTEAFEKESGRSVIATDSTIVSSLDYLIGYKLTGDYSFIKQGDSPFITIIGVNENYKKTKINNLKKTISKITYENILTKQSNGTFAYSSTKTESVLKDEKFNMNEEGIVFNLDTNNVGEYLLQIFDEQNNELFNFKYTVRGEQNLTRSLERNAELKVELDKKSYNSGDNIQMEIKAPFTGHALITIEKEKVYEHKWVKLNKKTTMQKIIVPANVKGNAYVNIVAIRSINSPEIYTSAVSYGAFPISINQENLAEKIELKHDEVIRPGETLKVNYKTNHNSDIVIFAVDEGILQFAGYKNPNPIAFFLAKKSLDTRTIQNIYKIMPEDNLIKDMLTEGGGSGGALSANLNPFQKKRKAPVAYWSGILKSSTHFKTWDFKVPTHFNGQMRLIAVAVSKERMGRALSHSFVRADLIMSSSLPSVTSPGDKLSIPITVMNNIEDKKEYEVSVESITDEFIKNTGNNKLKSKISYRKDHQYVFNYEVGQKIGESSLRYIAKTNKFENQIEENISVRPTIPYINQGNLGVIEKDKKLYFGQKMYNENRKKGIIVGKTPLVFAKNIINFLDEYTFLCTEQLISQGIPYITLGKFQKKSYESIRMILAQLQDRINQNGDIVYYPGTEKIESWLKLHVLHFLIVAKENEFPINHQLIETQLRVLKEGFDSISNNFEKTYAIYLMTRNQIVTTPFIKKMNKLIKEFETQGKINTLDQLSIVFLASSYQLLGNQEQADKLHSLAMSKDQIREKNYLHYTKNVQDLMLLNLNKRHFSKINSENDNKKTIEVFTTLNKNLNTLAAAHALYALNSLPDKNDEVNNVEVYSLTLVNGKETKNKLEIGKGELSFKKDIIGIEIINKSGVPLYYSFTDSGFPKDLSSHKIKNFEISKEYIFKNENIKGPIKRGDNVEVLVKVRVPQNCTSEDIIVKDLFPTGFELDLNSNLEISGEKSLDFIDKREDRVVFYGGLKDSVFTMKYKLKATVSGTFKIPPSYSEHMYNPNCQGIGELSEISVE
ncbi:MAG: hypothetical protein H6622_01835 [Halobacteriovoraceae bacterium]|nr:hypothetical protein [Halobacteriovoraceae bacterium]